MKRILKLKTGQIIWLIWGVLVLTMAASLLGRDWPGLFIAVVTFSLTLLPILLPKKFNVHLPTSFIVAIVFFIFSTIFLGEYADFYNRFWWWDVVLHIGSGFGFGLLGVIIVLVLYRRERIKANPFLLAAFAFCFALSIGAMWEIIEFLIDEILNTNMQKSGLRDTMFDLIVDAGGSLASAVVGYFYLKSPTRGINAVITEAVDKNS